MSGTLLHEMKKPGGDCVRLMFTEYRNKRYVDLRLWVDKGGEGLIATRKGVTLPLDSLDDFAEAFARAVMLVRSGGA